MIEPTLLWILIAITTNFFAFSLIANVERAYPAKIFTYSLIFGFTQLSMTFLGLLLSFIIIPFFQNLGFSFFHTLVGIIGVKRLFQFYSYYNNPQYFSISQYIDALKYAIALSFDALIFGIALGFSTINIYNVAVWIFTLTVIMSGIGFALHLIKKSDKAGPIITLISGIGLILLGFVIH